MRKTALQMLIEKIEAERSFTFSTARTGPFTMNTVYALERRGYSVVKIGDRLFRASRPIKMTKDGWGRPTINHH